MANHKEKKVFHSSKVKSRREILIQTLPKYFFHLHGSYCIWRQLIGPQSDTLMEKFHEKLKTLNADEKYAFANLIYIYGLDLALHMMPIPGDDYGINLHTTSSRTFCDASTQFRNIK